MEIKKNASIATIVDRNNSAESEKKSEKSSATGITTVKDSFQVATNNNGGLFSETRFAQPTGENSGQKDLTPSEQQQASGMDYKDFLDFKNSSSPPQDPQAEAIKNAGTSQGSGKGKQTIDEQTKERIKERTADSNQDLNSAMPPEQTNDAIRQLTGDTSLRDFVKQEIDERHQDYKLGNGTAMERFAKSLDPSSNQGSARPTGKDQIAYEKYGERKNADGSTTIIRDAADTKNGTTHVSHSEMTSNINGSTAFHYKGTEYLPDNTKVEKDVKVYTDGKGNSKSSETTTTTKDDGTVNTTTTTVTEIKGGSTTATTTEKTTPPGGGTKSYDPENYKGNIPEVLQRTMDHFKEQAKKLRPEGGGERVLTDGGASGTPVIGHESDAKISPKFGGITGMVGQPAQGENEIGNGNGFEGGSNADLNGGATDVDGNNWTGRTIEDDPTDVHFGPGEQPKKQKKDEESSDSSKSFLNQFRQIRA